jgi:heat shock protein HslJ
MRLFALLSALLGLALCERDETLSAYGAADKTWTAVELNGAPVSFTATITFPEPGRIEGRGPCNQFSAEQRVPYPWFEAGPIAATRRACPELAAERAYLDAIAAATISEVAGNTLLLSDDDGVLLVFKAGG